LISSQETQFNPYQYSRQISTKSRLKFNQKSINISRLNAVKSAFNPNQNGIIEFIDSRVIDLLVNELYTIGEIKIQPG
jgi:hypothetical protein